MVPKQLAIMDVDDEKTFVYCKDTVRIHAVSVKFMNSPDDAYPLKEFSLSDDTSIKCKPQVIYDDQEFHFEIEFTTPVPVVFKYEISLYYFDNSSKIKFANVLNGENIRKGDKFKLLCTSAFVGDDKYENDIDGNIILCSKICRKDALYILQRKPSFTRNLLFSQITDYSLLFENTALSNLTIFVENREFRVHKEILAAKSSVFLAMFETEMKEKRENQVKIEDIEANIFQELLRYIYTNAANDLYTHAEKLYAAADKYDLPKLKLICIDKLSRSLNVENAIHVFLFANENNETILKEITMDFIKKQMKLIFQTKGYKALCQSPKAYYIIDEIFRATLDYVYALK